LPNDRRWFGSFKLPAPSASRFLKGSEQNPVRFLISG
jgi:hypothetical protein